MTVRDEYDQLTDRADSDDEPCFQEVIDRVRELPFTTDAEKTVRDLLCDKLAYAVTKLKPETRQMIAEDMHEAMEALNR